VNWLEVLGWGEKELADLRVVAYSYIRQGIYDIALTFFDALEVLQPSTTYDLQTIGALHLQMGNALRALDYLERALRADPTHLPTQLNRAKALLTLGYKKQAVAQLQELEKCSEPSISSQAAALSLSASSI
jgi:predicted Zn-dependent protease